MTSKLIFPCGLEVASGQKLQTNIPVPGTEVSIPVTVVNGAKDGSMAVVSSGIHSGEYPGIECAIQLAQEIQPEDVSGAIVFIHPCNPTGFEAQISYFIPEDGKNLGHCFPGDPEGTLGDRIGHLLATNFITSGCGLAIDLHGGDLHERLSTFVFAPKGGDSEAVRVSMEITNLMNCKYVVLTGGGLTAFAVDQGIPSIVLERGDRGLWTQDEVEYYKRDVRNALRYLEIIGGAVHYAGPVPYVFRKCDMKYSPVSGCWYRNVELEEHFVKGQKLGEVRDFHGNVLHTVTAEYDGVCHSYWAALSIRKGQLMVGYGA